MTSEAPNNQEQAQAAITEFLNKMSELKFPAFACVLGDRLNIESSNVDLPSQHLFSLSVMFEASCAVVTPSYEAARERLQSSEASWKKVELLEKPEDHSEVDQSE